MLVSKLRKTAVTLQSVAEIGFRETFRRSQAEVSGTKGTEDCRGMQSQGQGEG